MRFAAAAAALKCTRLAASWARRRAPSPRRSWRRGTGAPQGARGSSLKSFRRVPRTETVLVRCWLATAPSPAISTNGWAYLIAASIVARGRTVGRSLDSDLAAAERGREHILPRRSRQTPPKKSAMEPKGAPALSWRAERLIERRAWRQDVRANRPQPPRPPRLRRSSTEARCVRCLIAIACFGPPPQHSAVEKSNRLAAWLDLVCGRARRLPDRNPAAPAVRPLARLRAAICASSMHWC